MQSVNIFYFFLGREFDNQYFKAYLKEKDIYFYTTNTNKKAAIAERSIQVCFSQHLSIYDFIILFIIKIYYFIFLF